MNKVRVPKVGECFTFYDDGKTSDSRIYDAKVIRVVPESEAENTLVDCWVSEIEQLMPYPLNIIQKSEVDRHRQSEKFIVLNAYDNTPGAPWLYAEDTDYYIECEIPEYDDNTIWFVRDIHGRWFSMNIQSSWQAGLLDIEGNYLSKRGL